MAARPRSRNRRNPVARASAAGTPLESDPLWYKDAIVYELRVGSFQDSDGDGIGDFRGLVQRLDYLQDLGVTAIWLLPFYPSPLRDDGYDIADYESVHSDSGTLEDFELFLREAHARGLRVITELVLNHTSDQHPWFQRSRRAPPGSRWRDFYVWSDTPERYREARVIFKDFEPSNWTWDPVAKAYYWHRFYAHQPDLNYDNPEVCRAVFRFVDFWLSRGVDGLRLDAVPYLFEREGTSCENLEETHVLLQALRRHVDERYPYRMLLAEANQWPEDAVAYFGKGDECHMAFHFPVMPRLFMALHMENRFPIVDVFQQTPPIPESCQWALFLRNHDELTLEMVTDEERDYMYRVYAHDARARINFGIRHRLAPLLGNDRRRVELMNALLFSLPGTPVIYYGDEIGMGDNIFLGDRNGVRTPMQWSSDRNAGFSRANPQRLQLPVVIDPQYHYESVNVEAQQSSPHSLLMWMKRLIALRKQHRAFSRGSMEMLAPSNRKVLAFVRRFDEEQILIVANLSRFAEYVELDLASLAGHVPVELFSRRPFPAIGAAPYLLMLGPHSFYWFEIAPGLPHGDLTSTRVEATPPLLRVAGTWKNALERPARGVLEAALPALLETRRWFAGKARGVRSTSIADTVPIGEGAAEGCFALIRVEYREGGAETYSLPLAFAEGSRAEELRCERPHAVFAEIEITSRNGTQSGILFDGLEDADFCMALLDIIGRRRRLRGAEGSVFGAPTREYRGLRAGAHDGLAPALVRAEQSNSSVQYGDRFILKLFRRPCDGVNPELEIGRFLVERARFPHAAPVAGALEYRVGRREPITLATLHARIPNEGDAWSYAIDAVDRYFDRVLALPEEVPVVCADLLELIREEPPPLVLDLLGSDLEWARLLGRRVAGLHRALASGTDDPAFTPEAFGPLYERSLYQSMRTLAVRVLQLLRERIGDIVGSGRDEAQRLLELEPRLLEETRAILDARPLSGKRIRCHGDLHLGQVLYTGNDFVFIDFEGEPRRSLGERRIKHPPLRDVAGMLRSIDYAAHHALLCAGLESAMVRPEDVSRLEPWACLWRQWVSSAFLRAYLRECEGSGLLPESLDEIQQLLRSLVLEKAIYELGYELESRPAWVRIPLCGILGLLEAPAE
jgi:maltose alpha-D-glucosyltransferase/alpha-amylase